MPKEGEDNEFDNDFAEEDNEEGNNSGKKNTDAEVAASKKEKQPADGAAKEEEEIPQYRSSTDKKIKTGEETVPLAKYLKTKNGLKAALKEARGKSGSDLNNKTLEDFAEQSGLKLETVKELASLISTQAREEAIKVADERVKPIVLEKVSADNNKAFEKDFERSIASKYPELANKKENFRKLAFSPEWMHLKTLEEIRKEFYPDAQLKEKEALKEEIEPGSTGGHKETVKIDFATLHSHPDLYEKVMKDNKLREKYYAWQDAQN